MTDVLFYHLERASVEQTLPGLLERTLARGWRALVCTGSDETAEQVDEALWTYADESFLPHGRTDTADQPILVTDGAEPVAGYHCAFLVFGSALPVASFSAFERAVVMFTEAEAPAARERWKEVKAAGFDATYWRQSPSGKWEKAA